MSSVCHSIPLLPTPELASAPRTPFPIVLVPLEENPTRREFRKALGPLKQSRYPFSSAPSAPLCSLWDVAVQEPSPSIFRLH